MKWMDVRDIALALAEKYPNEDVFSLRFTDLRNRILELEEFDDNPNRSNEKILEAIQLAWSEESEGVK